MMIKEAGADRINEKIKDQGEKKDNQINNALFNVVYEELRRQAHRYLRKERPGHTLQTTALVHEAYLVLINQKKIPGRAALNFLE